MRPIKIDFDKSRSLPSKGLIRSTTAVLAATRFSEYGIAELNQVTDLNKERVKGHRLATELISRQGTMRLGTQDVGFRAFLDGLESGHRNNQNIFFTAVGVAEGLMKSGHVRESLAVYSNLGVFEDKRYEEAAKKIIKHAKARVEGARYTLPKVAQETGIVINELIKDSVINFEENNSEITFSTDRDSSAVIKFNKHNLITSITEYKPDCTIETILPQNRGDDGQRITIEHKVDDNPDLSRITIEKFELESEFLYPIGENPDDSHKVLLAKRNLSQIQSKINSSLTSKEITTIGRLQDGRPYYRSALNDQTMSSTFIAEVDVSLGHINTKRIIIMRGKPKVYIEKNIHYNSIDNEVKDIEVTVKGGAVLVEGNETTVNESTITLTDITWNPLERAPQFSINTKLNKLPENLLNEDLVINLFNGKHISGEASFVNSLYYVTDNIGGVTKAKVTENDDVGSKNPLGIGFEIRRGLDDKYRLIVDPRLTSAP